MKRLIFTTIIMLLILACGTAQVKHTKGAKFPNLTESSNIPVGGKIIFTNPDNEDLTTGISLANLSSQLNLATGNLTQEEVEDILGAAFINASHSGATFVYNDNGTGAGTLDLTVNGGANDFVTAASLSGTTLTLTIPGQSDVQVDLSAIQDGIGTDDQTVDKFQLNGTTLELSLEGDGEADKTVDLSGLGGGGPDGLGPDGDKGHITVFGNGMVAEINQDIISASQILHSGTPSNGQVLSFDDTANGQLRFVDQTGGNGPVDNSLQDGSTNPVENDAIFDRFQTSVDAGPDSPEQDIKVWIGNKAAYNNRTPLDNYIYIVTDSVPSTPPGGGDMLKSVYDTDDDGQVDFPAYSSGIDNLTTGTLVGGLTVGASPKLHWRKINDIVHFVLEITVSNNLGTAFTVASAEFTGLTHFASTLGGQISAPPLTNSSRNLNGVLAFGPNIDYMKITFIFDAGTAENISGIPVNISGTYIVN